MFFLTNSNSINGQSIGDLSKVAYFILVFSALNWNSFGEINVIALIYISNVSGTSITG